ncbi:CRISPR system precrRNA processing endoribonuclease RAMP protein Cas6 [Geomonas subterranea]|uniref:CRISPR system precrRNA processing endoribonuclease RAMP protein Cas6 n=1 Tax=Geomonas subterranea TaxID=2847989 RepID=A0ABX8LH96_9BACT|nr:CRISPR system precrRNA processing endoribonuclease RAMP protein Cas6 [Geomonas subterranea]QXE90844.1 CRISPR system precrRNA processing endoribonuclease RAMP protein Cas6 [Geomonas subterranea]QXM11073.1 CRISPR system precrRNA processing endoribonuclease RAMP protein Cas6 [Geomonas subterranea]
MELHYAKLWFSFTLRYDLADPYAFYATRAEFESAFRSALSCKRGDCTGCRRGVCAFPEIFGQQIADDPEAVRRHQKPPLPFIFDFPVLPPPPNRGRLCELALTLVGNSMQHLPAYLAAVRVLVENKGGALTGVTAQSPGGERAAYAGEGSFPLPLLGSLDPSMTGPLPIETVAIRLLTPLKLVQEGRLLKNFTFANFARTLMRRVSSLAYHYEGAEPGLDYRWLSSHSESVRTVGSDCRFVSWNGRPAGILGSARFAGDLEPFHLLLQLGAATHLGKGASFGFGCYRVEG